MNHFRGYRGYALLQMYLALGLNLVAGIFIFLLNMVKAPGMEVVSPILMVGAVFLSAFLVVGRFMLIETRKPTLYDTNTIAAQTAAYFVIFSVAFYAVVTLIVWAMTQKFPETLSKQALANVGAGILGFIILFYFMIFLNFLFLTYFRQQPAGVGPKEFN